MSVSCLVTAVALAWLFVKLRTEIEPSKGLERPDTISWHLTHPAVNSVDRERKEKIIADYDRMKRWYPLLVQLGVMGSFLGSIYAAASAWKFAFPKRPGHAATCRSIGKDDDNADRSA